MWQRDTGQTTESDGGKGGSSRLRSLLEEVRKKCKESSGKGFLIIESRGGNLGSKILAERMWRKLVVEIFKERTCMT